MKNVHCILAILFTFCAVNLNALSDGKLATLQGESDARSDAKALTYGAIGCVLPLVTVFYNEFAPVKPPAYRLLGKSPLYVENYTTVYKRQIRDTRRKASLIGTAAGILGVLFIRLFVFD